jgi:O-antigen ligase
MRTLAYWLSMLFIFTVPWEAVVEDPTLGSAPRLIGLALAVVWVASVVMAGRIRKPTPFHLAVFLLVVWNALSIFWSANADRSAGHLVTWIQLGIMVFILWELLDSHSALLSGLQMYVLGAYVVFANAVTNFASGKTFYYERFSAVGTNPDDLGLVLALGIPVACYLAGKRSKTRTGHVLKWVNYAYIPAALLGIALSGTRTAVVAALPGLIYGLVTVTRLGARAKVVIAVLFVAAGFYILPLIPQASFDRLGTIGTEVAGGNWNGRIDLWSQGLRSFADNPILGVGTNMYRSVNFEGKVAHNSFISVLVEVGLVGLALFAIVLGIVVVQALKHPRWDRIFWLSVLAVWAIGAFTLTWEYRKPTWLFLSLVVISAALAETVPAQPSPQLVPSNPDMRTRRLPARPGALADMR